MALTRDDVQKIADLARLELSPAEVERYREQLSAILEYAQRLNELDLTAVPHTGSVTVQQNVWRNDELAPALPQAELLYNAPQLVDDQFLIQTTLDDA